MPRTEITGVPGVLETLLTQEVLDQLPLEAPGAPWECRGQAILWTARGGKAAAQALPPGLRQRTALAAVGGMVRYLDTPAGTYDEVLGAVAFREGRSIQGSVTFMAVDSAVSLVGGRVNWAMPKTLAEFDGSIASGTPMSATSATDTPWRVKATPRVFGPSIPVAAAFTVQQQFPGGDVRPARLHARGRGRAAVVAVEVSAETGLSTWLRPGRRLGAVIDQMTFTLGSPD
ncbi:acetoacetate decarboxylase family protein [Tomitella biformata]|uniref:acetoacetate decarboxylase family protein n=1 Tax=Tomitella biformata TaxID=630403 RepID=UPI000464618A|nr:acetoacetate decarboxylase family protein [Tomitella biformata]